MRKQNRIKEILDDQGRSQAWLAEKIGLTRNAINRICLNISQPNWNNLIAIADALGVGIGELVEDGLETPKREH